MDLTAWITDEAPAETKVKPNINQLEINEIPPEHGAKGKEVEEGALERTEDRGPKTAKNRQASLPWCEKYRPESLDDMVGNELSIKAAKAWSEQWAHKPPKKRALLIYGNVGTGKSSLAQTLAREFNWDILEMNASDKRTEALVGQIAGQGSQTRSFSGRSKVIIVEEIEGLSGVADRGAGKALVKVIKETRSPIIITCGDIRSKKLAGIKIYCEQAGLKKISPGGVVKRLGEILKKEGIESDILALQKIADNCEGDLRSAINDLQALAQGEKNLSAESVFLQERDRPIDVYKAMQKIFRCSDYSECRKVMWSLDEEPRNFIAWLDENIPFEYQKKGERARAFAQLSRADIFLGRVTNRQYWGFLRYVNDLMTVGVGFSKDSPIMGFSKYRFPSLIQKMGMTRGKRAKEASIAAKMSPLVHDSGKRIITSYLPLVKRVFSESREAGEGMVQSFGLDDEELEWLG
jgi:replication factor C large subunit